METVQKAVAPVQDVKVFGIVVQIVAQASSWSIFAFLFKLLASATVFLAFFFATVNSLRYLLNKPFNFADEASSKLFSGVIVLDSHTGLGVAEILGITVEVGLLVGVKEAVDVGVKVATEVFVGVGVNVGELVLTGVEVLVAVVVMATVAVKVGVLVAVAVAVTVEVGVAVLVAVGVGVGVFAVIQVIGVPATQTPFPPHTPHASTLGGVTPSG